MRAVQAASAGDICAQHTMPCCSNSFNQHTHSTPPGRSICRRPLAILFLLAVNQNPAQERRRFPPQQGEKQKPSGQGELHSGAQTQLSWSPPSTSPQSHAHPCRLRKRVPPGHKGAAILPQNGRQHGGLHHVWTPPSPAAGILPRPQRGALQGDGALLHCACRECLGALRGQGHARAAQLSQPPQPMPGLLPAPLPPVRARTRMAFCIHEEQS